MFQFLSIEYATHSQYSISDFEILSMSFKDSLIHQTFFQYNSFFWIFTLLILDGFNHISFLSLLIALILHITFSIFFRDSSKIKFSLNSGHLSSASIFSSQNSSSFKTSVINGTNG